VIAAVIFDMDGVLVDSEPLWRRAEVAVFGAAGVTLTEDDCKVTMGLRLDEVVRMRLPARSKSERERVEEAILERVIELVSSEGQPKDGAVEAVDVARSLGVPVALASSSPLRLIRATLDRLALSDRFVCVHSAERESHGKPHPAVYLTTAREIGAPPELCVAIEDSLRGVVSAKAASMRCVAIPEAPDPRFAIADLVLTSLRALDRAAWSALEHDR
jgi:sugar-phosphatase